MGDLPHLQHILAQTLNMYYVYFRVSVCDSAEHEKALLLVNPHTPRQPLEQSITHTLRGVLNSDLSSSVVSVCGVLLPKLEDESENGVTIVQSVALCEIQ